MKKKLKTSPTEKKLPADFFEMVYEVVMLVPKGKITSYGAIARYLGAPGAARIVGYAMNAAHLQKKKVPAQRVVNRVGLLSGKHHFEYPEQMKELLEKEGVMVVNDKVSNFKQHFWDPNVELDLNK